MNGRWEQVEPGTGPGIIPFVPDLRHLWGIVRQLDTKGVIVRFVEALICVSSEHDVVLRFSVQHFSLQIG